MGILGNLGDGVTGTKDQILSTLVNPFAKKVPDLFGPDFPGGFVIQEIINGVPVAQPLALVGNQLPMIPFSFGGEQKIVKDYYPGNSEPSVQVLGARETDIVVKGRLKAKRFKNPSGKKDASGLYHAPENIQREMDAIRIRGNLLQLILGEWKRFAYLEKTHFEVSQLSRIEYELTFSIVGFNTPTNCKFIDITKQLPFDVNKQLILLAQQFESSRTPPGFPKTLSGVINGYISDVASIIKVGTNFIDTTMKAVEDVTSSLNRGIGLVKNMRTSIVQFKRRLGNIGHGITSLGTTYHNDTKGLSSETRRLSLITVNTYRNSSYLNTLAHQSTQMELLLAKLSSQFAMIKATTPQARYLIKQNDSLQKIAVKFYNNADNWKIIYDHNHLTSTVLTPATLIEIPRV